MSKIYNYITNSGVAHQKSNSVDFCHGKKLYKKNICSHRTLNKQNPELCTEGFIGALSNPNNSFLANSLTSDKSVTKSKYSTLSKEISENCSTYKSFLKQLAKIPNFYDFLGLYKTTNGKSDFHIQGFYIVGECWPTVKEKKYYYVQPEPFFMAREIQKPDDITFTNNDLNNLKALLPNINRELFSSDSFEESAQEFLCPSLTNLTEYSIINFDSICVPSPNPTNVITITKMYNNNKLTINIPLGPPLLYGKHQPCQSIGRNFVINSTFTDKDIQEFSGFSLFETPQVAGIDNYCISTNAKCGDDKCWRKVKDAGSTCNEISNLPQKNVNGILVGSDGDSNCYYSTKPASDLFTSENAIKFGLPDKFSFIFTGLLLKPQISGASSNKYAQNEPGFGTLSDCQNWIKSNKNNIQKIIKPPYEIIVVQLENTSIIQNYIEECGQICSSEKVIICKEKMKSPMICSNTKFTNITNPTNIGYSAEPGGQTYKINSFDRNSTQFVPICKLINAITYYKDYVYTLKPSTDTTSAAAAATNKNNELYYNTIHIGYTDNLNFIDITNQIQNINSEVELESNCGDDYVNIPNMNMNSWSISLPSSIQNTMQKYPVDTIFNVGMNYNNSSGESNVVATQLTGDYLKGFSLVKLKKDIVQKEYNNKKSSTRLLISSIDKDTPKVASVNPALYPDDIISNMKSTHNAVLYIKTGLYRNSCYGYTFKGSTSMLNNNIKDEEQEEDLFNTNSAINNKFEIWLKTPNVNASKLNSSCSSYVQQISSYEAAKAFGEPGSTPNISCLNSKMKNLMDYSMENTWSQGGNKESFSNEKNPLADSTTNKNSIMNDINTDIINEVSNLNNIKSRLATSVKNTNDAIDKSVKWNIANNAALTNVDTVKAMEEDRYLHRISNNYHFFAWGAAAIVLVAASIKVAH